MPKTLLYLLLFIPVALFAQSSISGNVISNADKKPLADATVFLGSASIAGKTSSDGSFTLCNVKNGQYDVVVSCIGHETFHKTIMVNGNSIILPQIALLPKITALKEVKIHYDPNRIAYLQLFTRKLLGETSNAKQCEILNPEVIDIAFKDSANVLVASTDDFLFIENNALGYHIKLLLKTFSYNPNTGNANYLGSLVYQPMQGNSAQQKHWQKNREEAYNGSVMHFLRSCVSNTVEKEGFKVVRAIEIPNPRRPADSLIKTKLQQFKAIANDNNPIVSDSIKYWLANEQLPDSIRALTITPATEYVKPTNTKNVFVIAYPNYMHAEKHYLRIRYRDDIDRESEIILFMPLVYFDCNGAFMTPHSNTLTGNWAKLRIGDSLPLDYQAATKN